MTNEEKYLREHVGTQNRFRVPDGYFEQLATHVMEQLPEKAEPTIARKVTLRPWLYAAASIALVFVMGTTYYLRHSSDMDQSVTAQWTQAESTYMEDAADYAMIDNVDIYACLLDN